MVKTADFDKARDYVLSRLEQELSHSLTYHSLKHTQEEVVPAVEMLATLEEVGQEGRLLLLTAAYFHDLGYIRQRQDHESISIQLAEQNLPIFGYSDSRIAIIRGIIRATRLPQSPTNLLERIMSDADQDYLGHESFWKRNDNFRHELENFGSSFTDEEWYSHQLQFMQSHRYFTKSARVLRDTQKQQNIQEMKQLLDHAIQLKMT